MILQERENKMETVGYQIARSLAEAGVTTVFGVISIHNMPILDGIAELGVIRFVPARGEAGAMNMADSFSRVSGQLGVCLTSTGTAAGNAAGAQAEALTAGSRVLHITTQIDREFMDRDRAAIHDVPKQPEMLRGVSKAYFRIWDEKSAIGTLEAAIRAAMTPPTGPVSIEIPVDVQRLAVVQMEEVHDARHQQRLQIQAYMSAVAAAWRTGTRRVGLRRARRASGRPRKAYAQGCGAADACICT